MPSLDMCGPFRFTDEEICNVVAENMVGNFALGLITESGLFCVQFVGKSDIKKTLRETLVDFCKDPNMNKYLYFKYSYASDLIEAYVKECKNYHDFGENKHLDNKKHPIPPFGYSIDCPFCNEH